VAATDVYYDTVSKFFANPNDIVAHSKNIDGYCQNVADSITNINNAFKSLHVGWAGKTDQEAKDFVDRWNGVMTELFGTEKDPGKGILPGISGGLKGVAQIFGLTERAIETSFNSFRDSLTQGGDGNSDTPPQSITDVTTTAVTEQWQ
jgi:uncharacterized protein YukE